MHRGGGGLGFCAHLKVELCQFLIIPPLLLEELPSNVWLQLREVHHLLWRRDRKKSEFCEVGHVQGWRWLMFCGMCEGLGGWVSRTFFRHFVFIERGVTGPTWMRRFCSPSMASEVSGMYVTSCMCAGSQRTQPRVERCCQREARRPQGDWSDFSLCAPGSPMSFQSASRRGKRRGRHHRPAIGRKSAAELRAAHV